MNQITDFLLFDLDKIMRLDSVFWQLFLGFMTIIHYFIWGIVKFLLPFALLRWILAGGNK